MDVYGTYGFNRWICRGILHTFWAFQHLSFVGLDLPASNQMPQWLQWRFQPMLRDRTEVNKVQSMGCGWRLEEILPHKEIIISGLLWKPFAIYAFREEVLSGMKGNGVLHIWVVTTRQENTQPADFGWWMQNSTKNDTVMFIDSQKLPHQSFIPHFQVDKWWNDPCEMSMLEVSFSDLELSDCVWFGWQVAIGSVGWVFLSTCFSWVKFDIRTNEV